MIKAGKTEDLLLFPWYRREREENTMAASSALRLILGSSSASRRQILAEMGYQFKLLSADIDEKEIRKEKPEELVVALAHAKADAILDKMRNNGMMKEIVDSQETTLLITADQVVVHDGVIREKPTTPEEARKFIQGYSQSHAATIGSVLVTNVKTGTRREGWDRSEVYFHKIPNEVVESLIEEGNVFYVAGGLLVEHPLTSPLVEAIVGTIDSVMGLPKALTEQLIKDSLQEP
ncbi:7-methyl-GTP pyrophosphatase-like [Triticum dicoccoides]|uniref:7-methyl-GTP pyrophosphatase-like n=1 Tax=Triticum dicoccoides TaxID=85692 RepID=UPI000E79DE2D|nr:7-methyl-GTP pyrophosphatase-like [Triticum dicoccoides]